MTAEQVFPDLLARFAEVVERWPDAAALSDAGGKLSYAQLSREADALARQIGRRMTPDNRRVGICLPRGRASVVATVATIKAGGIYVPLDPALPDARLATIVRDAAPALTIIVDDLPAARRRSLGRTISYQALACAAPAASEGSASPPPPHMRDACILYTSGTTGKPKGVVVPGRGITRLVMPQPYLTVTPEDRVLHHSNLSFDASTFEIWAALLNGATLVPHATGPFDLESLASTVRDERISVMLVTTGLFHLIADLMPGCFRNVRVVLTGGEALYGGPVRRVLSACPSTSVVNGYGPTENTVYTTCHLIQPGATVTDPIPLGQPIAGTEIRIDAPESTGGAQVGELLVSGVGLSPGYFNNEALTTRAFARDDAGESSKRFYRTGDLVRRGGDGHLYFVGRVDNQIKLRGFRIEVEEIESCINGIAGVAGSAVTLHGALASSRHLVAHVKLGPAASATPASIKSSLARVLPSYMVPSVIVGVDAMPLTFNGKIDRARLAASYEAGVAPASNGFAVAPAAFQCILDSWRKHLDAPELDWHDNVFDRGASSLTAVGVQIDVDRALACDVPMIDLISASTPSEWVDVYAHRLQSRSQPSG